MKGKLIFILKLLLMAFIFVLISRKIDTQRFLEVVRHAKIGYLLGAVVVIWIGHLWCLVRWGILLEVFNIPLRYSRLVAIYSVGIFASLFLPSLVGGDAIKLYLAGREAKRSYTVAFASVFMDRMLGLSALVLVAFVFSMLIPVPLYGVQSYLAERHIQFFTTQGTQILIEHGIQILTTTLFIGFIALNFLIFYPPFHNFLSRKLERRLPAIARRLDLLSNAFVAMLHNKATLIITGALSVINHVTSCVVAWLIALSLGEQVPFLFFLVLIPIMNLVAMLPLTPMGLGLREATLVSLFTTVANVSPEKGLAIGGLLSMLLIITGLPAGLFYLTFKRHGQMDKISEVTTAV